MIIMIAAIGKNNELGKNNKLLWYLPSDLRFFKEKTMNKKMIMGRVTFESFKSPLKGRYHIVITNQSIVSNYENVIYTNDVEALVNSYKDSSEEVYVIGGAIIYNLFLPYASIMYLTEVNFTDPEADTYFPFFNKNKWERQELDERKDNDITYKHIMYTKMR
jgi:dihydrofolate reductase